MLQFLHTLGLIGWLSKYLHERVVAFVNSDEFVIVTICVIGALIGYLSRGDA